MIYIKKDNELEYIVSVRTEMILIAIELEQNPREFIPQNFILSIERLGNTDVTNVYDIDQDYETYTTSLVNISTNINYVNFMLSQFNLNGDIVLIEDMPLGQYKYKLLYDYSDAYQPKVDEGFLIIDELNSTSSVYLTVVNNPDITPDVIDDFYK